MKKCKLENRKRDDDTIDIIHLLYQDGLSFEEIAKITQTNIYYVRSVLLAKMWD